MAVIEVDGLVKRYGDDVVVDDVPFTVERGEIFGILGRNGAGKTTTVECLEGLRRPDAGRIRILDLDPHHDRTQLRTQLGAQLQHARLPDQLRVGEALALYRSFSTATVRSWAESVATTLLGNEPMAQGDGTSSR